MKKYLIIAGMIIPFLFISNNLFANNSTEETYDPSQTSSADTPRIVGPEKVRLGDTQYYYLNFPNTPEELNPGWIIPLEITVVGGGGSNGWVSLRFDKPGFFTIRCTAPGGGYRLEIEVKEGLVIIP